VAESVSAVLLLGMALSPSPGGLIARLPTLRARLWQSGLLGRYRDTDVSTTARGISRFDTSVHYTRAEVSGGGFGL
jgi:hypothetical protein